MLTINADDHALMKNYHRPEDEKRVVVILREEDYDAWLKCPPKPFMESEIVRLLLFQIQRFHSDKAPLPNLGRVGSCRDKEHEEQIEPVGFAP